MPLLSLLGWPVSSLAAEWRTGLSFDSFNANESTSIHSISGNWNRPIHGGDQALSVSRMRLFIERDALRVAYLQRHDIHYAYSNDIVSLLYQTENKLPLPANSSYELFIRAKRSSSAGLQFGYSWQIGPELSLRSDISLLTPRSLQAGFLTGQASSVSDTDYDFNFVSDLAYDEDPLYARQAQSIDGDGYAVDVGLDYRPDERWYIQLDLLDIAGHLNIPDAPHTSATASSATKQFDAQGYLIYEPVVRGREDFSDTRLNFDMQLHVDLAYRFDASNRLSVQHHSMRGFDYRQVEWIRDLGAGELRLIALPELDALGIGGGSDFISATLIADSLDYRNMQVFSFQIALSYDF